MRVFQNKWFTRFARDERISDARLCQAVRDAEAGRIDADYGGGVIKQRVARPNEGKSGGYRCVILYRKAGKAFFVYGFPKNERANVRPDEVRAFKDLANGLFALSDEQVATLIHSGALREINCDDEDQNL